MRHLESKLQQSCVMWFELQYRHFFLFAIPNGGGRSKIEASIMVGEGVKSGVPDLFLAEARHGKNGLFIEMKSQKGKLSKNQKIVQEKLRFHGYQCETCKSVDEFINLINKYLS